MNTVSTPKPLVKRDELDQILWDVSGEESTKNERTKAKQDIISLIESARREGYREGFDNCQQENDEYLDEQAGEEAHRTEEGYCCACGYDMAVMAEKIEKAKVKERQRVVEMIEGKIKEAVEWGDYTGEEVKNLLFDLQSKMESK